MGFFDWLLRREATTDKAVVRKGAATTGSKVLEAAKSGDVRALRTLLEQGADPNTRDPVQAWTPLMRALDADHVGVAERLIEAGADVNAAAETGTTALMVAAGKGHAEIVRLLLEAGADPSARDMHGKTALGIVDFLIPFNPRLAPTREMLTRAASHKRDKPRRIDEAVVSVPTRDQHEEGAKESASSLVEAGNEAVPRILAALQRCAVGARHDHWWDEAPGLCDALARIASDEAKRALVTILNTDSQVVEWDQIRSAAAKAIGRLGDGSLVRELSAASNQPHAPVLAIEDAIAALGGSTTQSPKAVIERGRNLEPQEAAEYFAAKAERISEWDREARGYFYSAWAAKIDVLKGQNAALPYYAAALAADADPLMVAWSKAFPGVSPSAEAAAELASRHPLPADPVKAARDVSELLKALENEKWDTVRLNAASALGQLRNPAAVPGLIRALSDKEWSVKYRAALSLGRLRDERATQPLLAATRDGDHHVVEAAAQALGEIGDPAATQRLEELLSYDSARPSNPLLGYEGYSEANSQVVREAAREALDKVKARSN